MAYTVRDKDGRSWVRLIDLQGKRATVKRPFDTEWVCDPCNPSRSRYRVRHTAGWMDHPWYAVITNDDTARARFDKLSHARKVIAAAQEKAAAEYQYRRLVE